MADEINKVILLDVRVQSEEAEKRSAEITSKLATFKQEYTRLQKELKNDPGNKHLAASLNAVDLQIRSLNKEQAELRRQAQLTDTVNKTQIGTIENLRAQLSLNTIEWNKLTVNERENTITGRALAENTKNISDKLKVLEGTIGDTRRNVGNYRESIEQAILGGKTFSGSLSELRKKYEDLEAALEHINIDDPRYKTARKSADDLKLKIQQVTGAVNEFGEREPRNPAKKAFEDAFQSAGAAVNTIQLLNLVIGQNGDASVLQAKAIQTVAVAQTVANIVRSKGEVIDTLALAKTKLLTFAQRVYAVAVGQSTGALKVLRIAMLATVAGAVLVGIGILAQKIGLFGKATKDAADESGNMAAAMNKAGDAAVSERVKVEQLVTVAKDEKRTKEQREEAIKRLNEISPKYLGNLTLETINTNAARDAIRSYLDELSKKAKAQALFDTLIEAEQELFKKQQELDKARGKLGQAFLPGTEIDLKLPEATKLSAELNGIQQNIKEIKNALKESGDAFQDFGDNTDDNTDKTSQYTNALLKLQAAETILVQKIQSAIDAGRPYSDLQKELLSNREKQIQTERDYAYAVAGITDLDLVRVEIERLRIKTIAVITDGLNDQIKKEKELGDLKAGVTLTDRTQYYQLLDLNSQLIESESQLMAARIDGIQQASGALGGLAKEGSRAQKVLFLIQQGAAVAEVIFNTAKALSGISAGLAQTPPFLFPGVPNPAFPVAAGIAAVQSAKVKIQAGVSIGSILAATLKEFKAEKGTLLGLRKGKSGVFGGKPHSSGGTRGYFEDGTALEVEEGEVFAVVNKQDSKTLRGLSDINSRHGKSFFREGGMKFQDGGFAARYISNPVINRFEARNNARLMARSVPPQVVTVEDINAKTAERTRVVERANL